MRVKYFLIVVLTISLSSCYGKYENLEGRDIYIDHYKQNCTDPSLYLCFRSRETPNGEWTILNEPIQGFDYEWGYTYKLNVLVENPTESSSTKMYALLEILSKELEPNPKEFSIKVRSEPGVFESLGEYGPSLRKLLYGELDFTSTAHQSILIYTYVYSTGCLASLSFRHRSPPNEPLILNGVGCSSSREVF